MWVLEQFLCSVERVSWTMDFCLASFLHNWSYLSNMGAQPAISQYSPVHWEFFCGLYRERAESHTCSQCKSSHWFFKTVPLCTCSCAFSLFNTFLYNNIFLLKKIFAFECHPTVFRSFSCLCLFSVLLLAVLRRCGSTRHWIYSAGCKALTSLLSPAPSFSFLYSTEQFH